MNLENEISAYDHPLQVLKGDSIRNVIYYEIDYGEPCFDLEEFHSLAFGLQFEMESGLQFYFTWGNYRFHYDLNYSKGSIESELKLDGNAVHVVSQHPKWIKFIGNPIKEIRSYWSWVNTVNAPKSDRTYYPLDIKMVFADGNELIVSAMEIENDEILSAMADNIIVFFDKTTALKYEAGIEPIEK